jgi:hypothetical protein
MTVEEFFREQQPEPEAVDVALEHDLRDLFTRKRAGLRPAADLLRQHRATLVNKIEYWTGVRRSVVRALVDRLVETADRAGLAVAPSAEAAAVVEVTTYATALAMNYLTHGSFLPRARRRPPRARRRPAAAP